MAIRPFPRAVVAEVPPSDRARFRRWVRAFGIARLSRSLTIDRRCVYRWISADKPQNLSPESIHAIIALSTIEPLANGKPLTYEDIMGKVRIAGHSFHDVGRSKPRQKLTRRVI